MRGRYASERTRWPATIALPGLYERDVAVRPPLCASPPGLATSTAAERLCGTGAEVSRGGSASADSGGAKEAARGARPVCPGLADYSSRHKIADPQEDEVETGDISNARAQRTTAGRQQSNHA